MRGGEEREGKGKEEWKVKKKKKRRGGSEWEEKGEERNADIMCHAVV